MIGLKDASKAFGGTLALRNVTFDLHSGEVLALLGENGAGGSPCVKMFAGVYQPTLGHVVLDDQPAVFSSPLDAQRSGIAVMHQHPGLFPDLSVAENVFMGHMPQLPSGAINRAAMRQETASLSCFCWSPHRS